MSLDALIGFGADATRRAVPVRKRYARAIGRSLTRATRHRRGDEHAPATGFLVALATAEGGSAWPMIAEGVATVLGVSIRKWAEARLWARLNELDDHEHDAEADETRCTVKVAASPTAEQLEAAARANLKEAELQLERVAILRELARRKRNG